MIPSREFGDLFAHLVGMTIESVAHQIDPGLTCLSY